MFQYCGQLLTNDKKWFVTPVAANGGSSMRVTIDVNIERSSAARGKGFMLFYCVPPAA